MLHLKRVPEQERLGNGAHRDLQCAVALRGSEAAAEEGACVIVSALISSPEDSHFEEHILGNTDLST